MLSLDLIEDNEECVTRVSLSSVSPRNSLKLISGLLLLYSSLVAIETKSINI